MKKIITITIILVAVAGIALLTFYKFNSPKTVDNIKTTKVTSYLDATYTIDGKQITLKSGSAETESSVGSASKVITKFFGNEVKHDFDGDGREDVTFLITQETGGSGVFYYVVSALNKTDGYVGSQALFLGDRIAPQSTKLGNGNVIIVNYAGRAPGESFATSPSIGKSLWLLLDTETLQFGEVAQNFEGEADPSRMTLTMKNWKWVKTSYNNDTEEVAPKSADKFSIIFKVKNVFSATTDCNSIGGEYLADRTKISFSKMVSTLMYCEGSQESIFSNMLSEIQSYHFTSKGELIFDLKFDSGSAIFR